MKSQRIYHVIRGQRLFATETDFIRAQLSATRHDGRLYLVKEIEVVTPTSLPPTRAAKRKRRVA
jgi:hypothetical protein